MMRLGFAVLFSYLAIAAFGQSPVTIPDGTTLAIGDYCYTITAIKDGVEKPIGLTFQSVKRKEMNGGDVLAIVVHQHLLSGKFDIRDSFLLRRKDLRPITLDTDRDGAPHVHLDYTANRVTGWKMSNGTKQPIDVSFDGPVWDGNLWGETFAALPLKLGGAYQLPVYQYDSGKGSFYINAIGRRDVTTPIGHVDSWVLQAGLKPAEQVEYTVGGTPRLELAYTAGPSSQHLGGDCSSLH